MEAAPRVGVAGREHGGHGLPADRSAAQPHQRAEPCRQPPDVERLAGRERVEVAGEDVEPGLARLAPSAAARPARSAGAAPSTPRGRHSGGRRRRARPSRRASARGRRGATAAAAATPTLRWRRRDRKPSDWPRCEPCSGSPLCSARAPHDVRPGRFLQDHQVGRAAADHRGQRVDPADAAVADVVGEQPQGHDTSVRSSRVSVSGFSISVR